MGAGQESDGSFDIKVEWEGIFLLLARAPGYAAASLEVVGFSKLEPIEFTLRRPADLTVHLPECKWPRVIVSDDENLYHLADLDDTCQATIRRVAPGTIMIWPTVDGKAYIGSGHTQRVEAGKSYRFEIQPWYTSVMGMVLVDGRPTSEVNVELEQLTDLGVLRETKTNELGRFEFLEIEPGEWKLKVRVREQCAEELVRLERGLVLEIDLTVSGDCP